MRRPSLSRLFVFAGFSLAACASTAPPPSAGLATEARREVFESAWSTVAAKHFDPKLGGVDWNAVHARYAPRVDACPSDGALLEVLNQMVGELGHSHVAVMPPRPQETAVVAPTAPAGAKEPSTPLTPTPTLAEPSPSVSAEPGGIGIRVAWVDGAVRVVGLSSDSPAYAAGMRMGETLLAIDGQELSSIADDLRREAHDRWAGMVPYVVLRWTRGAVGTPVDIQMKGLDGTTRTVAVQRVEPPMASLSLGNLGILDADFESRMLPGNVLYIRFSPCFVALQDRFEKALEAAGKPAGVIIDLRGNPGGLGALAMGIARSFLREPAELGVMRMRPSGDRANEIHFRVNPAEDPFAGPLVLLVDGSTGSTAEILAAGLQSIGRARVVGATSMGAALPATIVELPHGWRLMTVVADFHTPDGKSVEGRGAVPDVAVELRAEDLAAGRDTQIEAAIAELANAPLLAVASQGPGPAPAGGAEAKKPIEASAEAAAVMDRIAAALGGADVLRRHETSHSRATISLMGMTGTIDSWMAAPNRARVATSIPGMIDSLQVCDGERVWSLDTIQGLRELDGVERAQTIRSMRTDAAHAWRDLFAKVVIVRRETEGGREWIVVEKTPHPGEGDPGLDWIDAATGLPGKSESRIKSAMGEIAAKVEILEWGVFDGVKTPTLTRATIGGASFETRVLSVEYGVAIDPHFFDKPTKKSIKKAKAVATESAPAASEREK